MKGRGGDAAERPANPLPARLLYRRCDPAELPFATTAELEPLDEPVGQERAVAAIDFAIGIKAAGFNLFALGPQGTGRTSLVRQSLQRAAAGRPLPDDWCYVNNFAEPHRPRALRLPPGRALALRKDMERLVEDLASALPAAFEGDEYRTRRHAIDERLKARQDGQFEELRRRAAGHGVALIRTPVGLALAPMQGGEVVSPEDFEKLPEDERERLKAAMAEMQDELEAAVKVLPQWQRERRDEIRVLDQQVARFAVAHGIDAVLAAYADLPAVCAFLETVREDVLENIGDFLDGSEGGGEEGGDDPADSRSPRPDRRYRVNVVVSHAGADGAPVVFEDHPTQPNLVGRVEHQAQFGALITDFNLIKAGALHRANGGYLVLDAARLLTQPFAWEDLKRALQSGVLRIESPGQSLGLMSTVSLEPEPIPLDAKVVLIGSPALYYLLSHYDPDFPALFKVAADFDYRTERSERRVLDYARLVATLARQEKLKALDRFAVARLVEHAARLAGDAEKLTTHMASLADLVREADYWAARDGAEVVGAAHVQRGIDAQTYRSDRVREHVQDEIRRGTLMIDCEGARTGQVNGLSVMQLGRFAFGRPSRITCRVRFGKGEVLDIEREVELGGPLHSKGVLILSSFLAARFGGKGPLSLAASLVFEQSYGGIDGDSASSAELYALLSALSDTPIRQGLAVTGSVNQNGEVQAIGGVNEKIEGFFDVCRARGLTGGQGVLVPLSNLPHLMLRADVVEAAERGLFHVHAVADVDEGIEILTGVPAGRTMANGDYPVGSVNRRVAARLAALAREGGRAAAENPRNGRKAPS